MILYWKISSLKFKSVGTKDLFLHQNDPSDPEMNESDSSTTVFVPCCLCLDVVVPKSIDGTAQREVVSRVAQRCFGSNSQALQS